MEAVVAVGAMRHLCTFCGSMRPAVVVSVVVGMVVVVGLGCGWCYEVPVYFFCGAAPACDTTGAA